VRRGSRLVVSLVVLVMVLTGIFLALDRVGANAAEDRIATQAAQEMSARNITSPAKPTATVAGFPFLTQVLRGRYDQVTINVDQPRSGTVQLDKITLVARRVRASMRTLTSGNGPVTADVVSGTASMDWRAVVALMNIAGLPGLDPSKVQISVLDNQVRLRLPISVAGQQMTLTAAGSLAVSQGKVRLTVTKVTPEGKNVPSLIVGLLQQYERALSVDIKIPPLPYRLVVNRVQSSEAGIVATASAENVVLAGA
jgi:DUF2993 family protein